MPRTVVSQISDPHIPGPGDELFASSNPVGNLTAALRHAAQRSTAVVVTGDCVARAGTENEYRGFSDVLNSVEIDVLLCAGNHDESQRSQSTYGLAGVNGRLDYVKALPEGQLIVMAVVSGHAHMTISAPFAGTTAYICPSVAYEFAFRGRDLIYRPGLP